MGNHDKRWHVGTRGYALLKNPPLNYCPRACASAKRLVDMSAGLVARTTNSARISDGALAAAAISPSELAAAACIPAAELEHAARAHRCVDF